jgi:SynChlorMet cassette protein ScmC
LSFSDIIPENLPLDSQADTLELLGLLTGSADYGEQVRGYSLCLGDGSSWWFAGTPRVAFLPEKLAAIMKLQETCYEEDSRLMFFYDKNEDFGRSVAPLLIAQGWVSLYHSLFQIYLHPKYHHVLCEYDFAKPKAYPYALMCFAANTIHCESISRGGVSFHAALLQYQGQGVLLAAPGETGKTTCSRRVTLPWQARCDDGTLVVRTPSGRYLAHPLPTWNDYLRGQVDNTWDVADALPVAGVFFLEQSPEDEVIPLDPVQAAVSASRSAEQIFSFDLLFESTKARNLRLALFENACALAKQIPAFILRVSLTGKFWEKIEEALSWS